MRSWRCRAIVPRSEEHTSELQSQSNLVCRLLLEKKQQRRSHLRRLGCVSRATSRRPQHRSARRPTPRSSIESTNYAVFFFNAWAATEIYTLSLHDALPI